MLAPGEEIVPSKDPVVVNVDDSRDVNGRISRRRFGATLAAGGAYTTLHQLLGTAASQSEGQSELCEMTAGGLAAPLVRQRPEWVKDTIKFEVAQAEKASAADVGRAMTRQSRMYDQSRLFFERYEYFILPVTQVEPFDVNTPYPTEIAGTAMTSYIDWMRSCWYVTMMANPAISVPAGFSASGLPVGLQIVGRHRDDWSVLQLAHAFELATRHGMRRPSLLD